MQTFYIKLESPEYRSAKFVRVFANNPFEAMARAQLSNPGWYAKECKESI